LGREINASIILEEVANRLHEAMEGGELIEDAEYEAAKNEQAFVEGRIQELEMLLANARVIEETGKMETVQIAAKVTIQEGDYEPENYIIVGPAEANPREGDEPSQRRCGDRRCSGWILFCADH
jgi:transcription elongation factor GreA